MKEVKRICRFLSFFADSNFKKPCSQLESSSGTAHAGCIYSETLLGFDIMVLSDFGGGLEGGFAYWATISSSGYVIYGLF